MTVIRHNSAPASPPEGTLLRLKSQLDSLAVLLDDADDADFHRRPADGSWTAHEHLAHLGRYHEIFLDRLDRILTEDRPSLGRYRAEEDPGAPAWFSLPTAEVLDRMRQLRAQLVQRFANLKPGDWRRAAIHPAFGEMSLHLWLEFFLVHESHHLYSLLRRLRERSTGA